MKPMLKAKFFDLVNSLLARGIKPEVTAATYTCWGNLKWEENGKTLVEPLYQSHDCSSLTAMQSRKRFIAWFSEIMAAHEAAQEVAKSEAPVTRERKTVTVKGITWTILSANERCTTVEGRHFFAGRCGSKSQWYLREHDCNITESSSGAREVGYLQFRLDTDHLSLAVLDVVRSPRSMMPRDVGRTALIHLTQPAPAAYLIRIGAVRTQSIEL